MNNDLISREALKKKLQARHDNGEEDFDKGYNIGIETAMDLIDNAPTVDALPREYHDKVLDMTVAELQACQANLRPQGKWKIGGKTTHYYYCSICGKDGDLQDNFCRNCGADMRGAE